uniref:Uncharacterized protein n=1 Tax=Tanacetum cinerariifolium TaxID=118510 RepID=A0A6L2KLS3_TANCI|nr:hypothetical protein [Tanacetum cinerariifolium]
MAAFTADGLSLRNLVCLKSRIHIRVMCEESWGQNSYVRALIEIRSDMEMKDSMVIAIPNLEEAPKKVVITNMDGFQNVKKRNASIKQDGASSSKSAGAEGIKMHINFYILGNDDVELEGMNDEIGTFMVQETLGTNSNKGASTPRNKVVGKKD